MTEKIDAIVDIMLKDLLKKYERAYELAGKLNITYFEKEAIAGYVSGYKMFEPVLKEEELSQEPICYARELAEIFKVLGPVWDDVKAEYERVIRNA